ncbi:MAG: hypothetical protein K8R23_03095 [Chthoniobacter sp.]|nr:hypothetical protein [Chthoniobacter sp.]
MTIPITWTDRTKIPNLPQLTEKVRLHGGSIVEFRRVWSLLLYCQSSPIYRWVPPGRSHVLSGAGHALFCLLFGWWSPAGIIWTLPAVVNNFFGGVDVTKVFTQPPPLPGQPWDPVTYADYIGSRRRQGFLAIASLVFVVGSLFYLGWRDVTRPKSSKPTAQTLNTRPRTIPAPAVHAALTNLAAKMSDIENEHEEITDTDIRERMFDVIFQGFIYRTPKYQAPQFYNTDSRKANKLVRKALTEFVAQANPAADAAGLDTPQKRLDAFNADPDLTLDEYFGYMETLQPPSPPITDQPGDMDRYKDES